MLEGFVVVELWWGLGGLQHSVSSGSVVGPCMRAEEYSSLPKSFMAWAWVDHGHGSGVLSISGLMAGACLSLNQ